MPDIPDVPDPSATEPPQRFESKESDRLRQRVFEVVASESDTRGIDLDPEPSEWPREPDKQVVAFDPEEESGGSGFVTLLVAAFAFMLGMGVVAVIGSVFLGILVVLLF
ncbi:MAG: hypothetical protein H6737_14895 [Alphaproteobacteria bacterium]|nr:hypothetical protein [Alphaproteobacteria bacterium]